MGARADEELAETLPASDVATADTAIAPSTGGATGALTREEPGRYARGAELGRGGVGRVVVADDRHLGREVALKELLASASGDAIGAGAAARFVREARVTGQLEHPSIVPVHELGQRADGTIYYTMKRIRGRSLASALREASSREERLAWISAFRDVCQAIAYAHSRGVVHRDLKPDNVMVGEFGETLVVDWGLAKVRGEEDPRAPEVERRVQSIPEGGKTMDGSAIGTPSYMAPEQARGDLGAIDERSDVWGLGAMLFEILTGRPPFEGPNAMAVLAKVLTEPAPRVRELEPGAPPELAAIADRALRRDPAERYASAREIADDVEAWQSGRAVRAYDYSSFELMRRFVRRNVAATVAATTIFVGAIVATGVVSRFAVSESRERARAETAARLAEDRELTTQIALAEALLERAERALAGGDPHAAAIYAAAALARDPANPDNPHHLVRTLPEDDARRARERIARAYSTYVEAEGAREHELVRRIEATVRSAIAGGRVVSIGSGALVAEDVATGAREELAIEGIAEPEGVIPIDDRRVLVQMPDRSAFVDVVDRRIERALPATPYAHAAAGRLALLAPDGRIQVSSLDDGSELATLEATSSMPFLFLSSDGARIAQPDPTGVAVRDALGATAPTRIPTGTAARSPSFSPDGRTLAIARSSPSFLLVDLETGVRREIDVGWWTGYVAWLDAQTLAVSTDTLTRLEIRELDATRPREVLHLPPAHVHVGSRVGELLLVRPLPAPDRPSIGSVLRRVPRARPAIVGTLDGLGVVGIDAPRGRIVLVSPDALLLHDLAPPHRLRARIEVPAGEHGSHPTPMGISIARDGAIAVAVADGRVMWIEPGGTAMRAVLGAPGALRQLLLVDVVIAPDGDTLYASSVADGTIRRWSRSRGELAPLAGHERTVMGLAISPDGHTLASAGLDGTARLWQLGEGDGARSEILARTEHLVSHVAFSPDGTRLATADGDGWIRVYEGTREVAAFRPHDQWIDRIAWWPDGRWIASGADDGTARVSSADGRALDRIVRCSTSCLAAVPAPEGDALLVTRDRELVRVPLEPGAGTRVPRELLQRAERASGAHLAGLEIVPIE